MVRKVSIIISRKKMNFSINESNFLLAKHLFVKFVYNEKSSPLFHLSQIANVQFTDNYCATFGLQFFPRQRSILGVVILEDESQFSFPAQDKPELLLLIINFYSQINRKFTILMVKNGIKKVSLNMYCK